MCSGTTHPLAGPLLGVPDGYAKKHKSLKEIIDGSRSGGDSDKAPELVDLVSEDDEPSDPADVAAGCSPPKRRSRSTPSAAPVFRKRSCVNFRAPIPDDREEPDGAGLPVEGLEHIFELPDTDSDGNVKHVLRVLFPREKMGDEAARRRPGYHRLGIVETVWDAVRLYNGTARAEGATEQELLEEHLDPSHIKCDEWIHSDLQGAHETGIRMTRKGTFCVRVVERGGTRPKTLSRHNDIEAAVEAFNAHSREQLVLGYASTRESQKFGSLKKLTDSFATILPGDDNALKLGEDDDRSPSTEPSIKLKLKLTPSAREAAERMRTVRLAARGEAPPPRTKTKTRKRTPEIRRNVCGIKGLHVLYEAFTEDVERTLFTHKKLFPFGATRSTASEKRIDSTLGLAQMPDDIMRVANVVRDSGLEPTLITPDHVLSQSYPPRVGFMSHLDSSERWGEVVVGVSLGADGVLFFTPNCRSDRGIGNRIRNAALENDFADYPTESGVTESDSWRNGRGSRVNKGQKSWALELEIPRRSVYVMSGAARTDLEHGIRAVKAPSQESAPAWNPLGVRRSLTIRAQKPYSDATLEHLARENPRDKGVSQRLRSQMSFKTAFEATTYGNTGRAGAEQARAFVAKNAATRLRFEPSQVGFATEPGAKEDDVIRIELVDEDEDEDDEDEDEWGVDEIVGKRVLEDGETQYKVAWSGTDGRGRPWKPSWEPESNLTSCREAVEKYETMCGVMKRSEYYC
ncbi:chromodomain-containing protein [Micromonas commoda]|uniref:Chromodomain-containing protein n=1 Tax=Micromonas commoda (strain RCC299 / NOUM17 / CCMP2709) TaxID=296587 RepID=C1FHB5_MICCC|nr:chromodomain-containing protein [Micromonas commoda]ACO70072.1 chromodomain-containing protein [Micromonas commoda]|eukprot:XP_002508814.1 chromodomain-containing protein [Micromonas commoda]